MRIFLLLPLLLASCTNTSPKSEKYQMEITLHKTRSDLEEAKHDLHTLKMELSILEGKMVNHEDEMASIKKETFDIHQTKLEGCHIQITNLDKKLAMLESKQEDIFLQLQKIATVTGEMSKALAQGKEKINELERTIAVQTKSTNEIAKKMTLSLEQKHE